jgi:tRNA threonylcarbamoyladenosine biosynthesis protein TsaE
MKMNDNPHLPLTFDIELPSVAHTEQFAERLAAYIHAPMTITLSGDIGAGKTTLVRAMLRSMGVQCRIKSPTYSLVESYDLPTQQIHHFDFYRLIDAMELDAIGFRDYFQQTSICCIEWPERIPLSVAHVDLALVLTGTGDTRVLRLVSTISSLWDIIQ